MGRDDESVITSTHRTGIYSIVSYDSADLPEEFNLGLTFEGKGGEQWEFSTLVKKQFNGSLVTVDNTQEIKGIGVTVSNLEFGPGGLLLTYQKFSEKVDRLSIMSFMDFRVVDSLGNELVRRESGSFGSDRLMKGTHLFDPVDGDATEVTITPYIKFPKQGECEVGMGLRWMLI